MLERVLVASEAAHGETSLVSLAKFDPSSRSWRTSGLFAVEDSPLFSATLPRSGMTRSGTLYLLEPLVRHIYGTGSGSSPIVPTPTANDANGSGSRNTANSKAHPGVSLTDWARGDGGTGRMLPTPTAASYGSTNNGKRGDGSTYKTAGTPSLETMARHGMLPTPQASDWKNGADYSDGSRGHSPQLRRLSPGRLNPRFVEWMMRYPIGFTDIDGDDA